jgi:radical SAM protein with 4Fe4S-binding SPASM domain
LITNAIARLADAEKLLAGEKVWPTFVDIHACDICNQRCVGCAYTNLHSYSSMLEHNHKKALDVFLDVGVKAFDFAGGGEPTLLTYLPAHMRYLTQRGASFGLLTNGTMLNDDLIDAILVGGTYCRISLEASSFPDYYTYKRVSHDVWYKVMGNIERLVFAKKISKSPCQITLKFSVGKNLRGVQHYMDAVELGNRLEVDGIQIKALRHAPDELTDDEKLIEDGHCQYVMHVLKTDDSWMKRWIVPESEIPQCWLNPLHVVMDQDGDLYICCFYYYRPQEHRIGNIFKDDFKKIWLSDEHRKKIAAIDKKQCEIVDCKFFRHHYAIEEALISQRGWFL